METGFGQCGRSVTCSMRLWLLLLAAAGLSNAQFLLRLRSGNVDTYVAPGGAATLNAKSRTSTVPFRVSLANRGVLPVAVLATELAGPADFSFVDRPTGEATLDAGQEFTVSFQYKATSDIRAQAQILFTVQDKPPDGTVGAKNVYILTLAANAADLALLRVTEDDNVVRVAPDQPISFPVTQGATSVVTFVIANRGAAPASALSVEIDSPDYQLVSLPLLPQTIDAGGEVRFGVRYTNRSTPPAPARLTVRFEDATTTVSLQPRLQTSPISLFMGQGSDAKAVPAGSEVAFPDTEVNARNELALEVRNVSGQPATLGFVATGGSGFTLSDSPLVPLTLAPQASAKLKIAFEPKSPGSASGTLRVNDDTFTLTGSAPGSQLKVSYVSGGSTVTVQANERILIDPAAVGSSTKLSITVQNAGSREAVVNPVTLVNGQAGFSLSNAPPTLTLGPGQTVEMSVTFQPDSVGAAEDSLRLGNQLYILSSVGRRPPDVPPYRITFTPEGPNAYEQPSVRLALQEPYPLALTGDLTLTITGNGAVIDPAVLFANGARSISFRIPANSTEAVFSDGSTSALLQTGTVAGAIALKPSFNTVNGFSVTPQDGPAATIAIAPAAPRLLLLRIQDRTPTGFVAVVSGFVTSRTLDKLNVQLGAGQFTVDVSGAAGTWFRNPASQAYGSQFSLAFPVSGSSSAAAPASISVSLTNEYGSSNTLQVNTQ
jgi:hypothetical protein